ncbi:MAG: cytochrome P450, partial [Acidimicrobiia bacterium]
MSAPEIAFNPFDPDFPRNPYPHYAALRASSPVARMDFGPVLLTRYEDVVRVLRDSNLSVEQRNALISMPMQEEMIAKAGDRSR